MKRLLTILSILNASLVIAQSEYAAYTSTGRAGVATTFETDYHAIGINPANLGFHRKYEDKSVTLGFFETAFSVYSEALTKDILRNEVLSFKNSDRRFTLQEKMEAAKGFVDAPLAINFDIDYLGISYFNEEVGGFGLTIRDRVQWYSTFNENFSNLMFLGYQDYSNFDQLVITYDDGTEVNVNNAEAFWTSLDEDERQELIDSAQNIQGLATSPLMFSDLFEGTRLTFSAYREYNFSWGKELKLNEKMEIGVGVGLKYLQGYAIVDINIPEENNGKDLEAYSAVSAIIPIDYGEDAGENPSIDTVNDGSYLFPEPAGKGVGGDLGINFIYENRIKAGIAFNNIGSINWTGNVFTAKDDTLLDMQSAGFDNYNIFEQASSIDADAGSFEWEGNKSKKVSLPSVFRGGASYIFYNAEDYNVAEIGFDVAVPLNNSAGNLLRPQFGIGGDYRPVKFIDISTGFTFGGNYGFNIPLGIDFIVGEGTYEFGFATRDIAYFFSNKSPNLSAAFGFLRFRF